MRIVIVIALVSAFTASVLQIIGPNKIKNIADEISHALFGGAVNMDKIWAIAIFLICCYAGSFFLHILEGWLVAGVTARLTRNLRTDLSRKINRLPMGYFNKHPYGDILSRFTNDVDTIGMTMTQSLAGLITAATVFLGSMCMMFYVNWILACVAIGTSLFGFLAMGFLVKYSQKYFKNYQITLGKINGQIEENFTGHNVIKVYNATEDARNSFEDTNKKLYTAAYKSQFYGGLMFPLMHLVGNFGYVAVCVAGAVMAVKGVITFGVIVAFMIYVRLFTQPLGQFAQAATSLQRTAAASNRVFEFLDEPEMDAEMGKTDKIAVKGAVEFKNVKFGYDEGKSIIHDFSAKISAGQKVAIVGPTGAGKTTVVNLLMRFFELWGGEILVDGVPTSNLTRETVHDQFCMVLQDTWVFEGTIKENIIYSKPNVTDDQVISACKAVDLHHTIMTLPMGYDTVLNEKAALSEGEKQLLTIARAIIKNAPMLILDEATSSVDTKTERRCIAAMDKLMSGRTSFIIAHRLSTIKNADLILVMRDGGIAEQGTHDQLLKKRGFYHELYTSQFED